MFINSMSQPEALLFAAHCQDTVLELYLQRDISWYSKFTSQVFQWQNMGVSFIMNQIQEIELSGVSSGRPWKSSSISNLS